MILATQVPRDAGGPPDASPARHVRGDHLSGQQQGAQLPSSRRRPEVSAVITSPPYPNRFSYARETRPHLFFFDFIEDAAAVGQLETDAIGGTWGRATSVLAEGSIPRTGWSRRCSRRIPGTSAAMVRSWRSYVMKYFNDICASTPAEIAEGLRQPCEPGLRDRQQQVLRPSAPQRRAAGRRFRHFGFTPRSHRSHAAQAEQGRPLRSRGFPAAQSEAEPSKNSAGAAASRWEHDACVLELIRSPLSGRRGTL